jgi:glucoamylase
MRRTPIAAVSAWSRLIEVQGFGQRYVDAGGATLGTVTIWANEISRFITFSVPKAMDVTTPAGVSQATELDYTVNQPVTIQGVFIP